MQGWWWLGRESKSKEVVYVICLWEGDAKQR